MVALPHLVQGYVWNNECCGRSRVVMVVVCVVMDGCMH